MARETCVARCTLLCFVITGAAGAAAGVAAVAAGTAALGSKSKSRRRRGAAAAAGGATSDGNLSDWGGGDRSDRGGPGLAGLGASERREEVKLLREALKLMSAEVACR